MSLAENRRLIPEMGRYITWQDVADSYPDWTKQASANTYGNLWIPRAEDEVDGRLAPVYTVPFSPTPGIVRDLCIDLAYFKLAFASEKGEKLGEILKDRFDAILAGKLVLTTSAGAVSKSVTAFSTHQDYPTAFGVDDPLNWRVSSAQAFDEQEARGQI
jgi:phage gp36-like protein